MCCMDPNDRVRDAVGSESMEDNQRSLNLYLKKKCEFSQKRKGRKSC